jgi:hypothetical protein
MASVLKVDKLDPQSGTALEIGSSGDTITIPSGATFTQSGTMNASAITAGTIATARLGSGTASSSTVLYGDQTYKAEPGGGKVLQVQYTLNTTPGSTSTSSTSFVTCGTTVDITPSATTSTILLQWMGNSMNTANNNDECILTFYRDSTQLNQLFDNMGTGGWMGTTMIYMDAPSSTSAITYDARFKAYQAGQTVYGSHASFISLIIAMEIDGS